MKTPLWKTTLWIAGFMAANVLPLNAADTADRIAGPPPHRRVPPTGSPGQPHVQAQSFQAKCAELRAKQAAGTLTQEEQIQLDRIEKRIAQGHSGGARGPRHAIDNADGPGPRHEVGRGPGMRPPHRRGGGGAPGAGKSVAPTTDVETPKAPAAAE